MARAIRIFPRLAMCAVFLAFTPGVAAQDFASGAALRACNHAVFGARAPVLDSPQAAADHLRRKPNFRIWWIHRYFASFFSTPVKRMGIVGWTDYCTPAFAVGRVIHADRSIDGVYTVDIALSQFLVNREETQLDGQRFVRVEVPRAVRKRTKSLPRRGEIVRIGGRLMWDHDGFLEIHPRAPSDIEILASTPSPI